MVKPAMMLPLLLLLLLLLLASNTPTDLNCQAFLQQLWWSRNLISRFFAAAAAFCQI